MRNARKLILIAIPVLILAVLFASGAAAQAPNPTGPSDDQVNAIARQLYCPVCENIPLDVCGTQACAQWRDLIRQRLAEGWSETQIKDYFVSQYGDRVLATPPARGFNWLVYVIPPMAVLAGAFILFYVFRSWKQPLPQAEKSDKASPVQDDYIKRVEEELRED
jgi:cytochrome c-type biogenesis protein CcmH